MEQLSYNPYLFFDYTMQNYVYNQYTQPPYFQTYSPYTNIYPPYFQTFFSETIGEEPVQNQTNLKKQKQNSIQGSTNELIHDQKKINTVQIQQIQEQKESSQYTPVFNRIRKRKKIKKNSKYLRKNTQSNISNQIFSYLSTKKKSESILTNAALNLNLDAEKIISTYYQYMKIIKKQKKKYLNKIFILSLCKPDINNPLPQKIQTSYKFSDLSILNFYDLVYILAIYFLNNICPLSIIESKKMDKQTRLDHLDRRRKLLVYLKEEKMKV